MNVVAYTKWRTFLWAGGVLLIAYSVVAGLLAEVPRLPILAQSIRMLYVHVPMWFGMVMLFTASFYYALRQLATGAKQADDYSMAFAEVGFCFGLIGIFTGMVWAKYTWGAAWSGDPKQNAAALSLLLYLAYFVLRASLKDERQRQRMSAVYNVLGYAMMIPLIFVLPRLTDSLHPGSGGNPGFNTYDLDNGMRLVFYPAVLGWILFGFGLAWLRAGVQALERQLQDKSNPFPKDKP